jgi:hypothetical protein
MAETLKTLLATNQFQEYITPALGEKCVSYLFQSSNPWSFSSYCVKLFISKAFSVIVISLCLFAKVKSLTR